MLSEKELGSVYFFLNNFNYPRQMILQDR